MIQPFFITFRNHLKFSIFPNGWKKCNVVLVQNIGNINLVNNYYPISLLHICFKVLKKFVFDTNFKWKTAF